MWMQKGNGSRWGSERQRIPDPDPQHCLKFTRLSCAGEKDEAGVCQVAGLWADPRDGGAAEWGAPHRPRLPSHQNRGSVRWGNCRGLICFVNYFSIFYSVENIRDKIRTCSPSSTPEQRGWSTGNKPPRINFVFLAVIFRFFIQLKI